MEKKLLKNVLLKLARGGHGDRVLFVDNIPEDLFYEMRHPRKVLNQDGKQQWVPDTDKAKVPTLKEHLSLSQTGDGGIVIDLDRIQAGEIWKVVDRYMRSVYPASEKLPVPVSYAQDPTHTASPPRPLSEIPRVVLPVLSPTEQSVAGSAPSTSTVDVEAIRRQAVEDYKKERTVIAAKAREAKARKAAKK